MTKARRALSALLAVTPWVFGCSSDTKKNQATACPQSAVCAEGTTAALSVGELDAGTVTPFTAGQKLGIIYGPQGGQHFLVDLSLVTDERGDWLATLAYYDDKSGALAGSNTRRMRACSCPALTSDVPVFLDSDQEVSGTLKASAESPSGQTVSVPDVQLTVTPFP